MRLKYLDSLRGLAMLMVVYSHILSFGMTCYTPSPVGEWLRDVMLPLFFFVSGYVAYKANPVCDIKAYCQQMGKKTTRMLIPTILMMGLMMLHSHNNMLEYLFRYDKGGYWFTWVLFQIILIYLPFLMLSSKVKSPIGSIGVLLLPIPLMLLVFRLVGFDSQAAVLFEWVKVKRFYLFFVAGAITRKIEGEHEQIFTSEQLRRISSRDILTLLVILNIAFKQYLQIWGGKDASLILSVWILYLAFRALRTQCDNERNRLSSLLIDIGRYTLPIYLIHFFLLFRLPEVVSEYLLSLQTDHCFGTNSCVSIVELFIVGGLSVLISYACIYITRFANLAFPFLAKWMLGEEEK